MADAGIYCGGELYKNLSAIKDLKQSGFTTVVAWSIHVDASGGLSINDDKLVTGNSYTGPVGWPERLADLKQGGSVTRLLFSVGAGETDDFTNIHKLIGDHGIGPDSPLHISFSALRSSIPDIDAIDFDDEDDLDEDTIVQFGQLMIDLGWEVTFCPFDNPDRWANCLAKLWSFKLGSVAGFNLQCYAGGASNKPGDWVSAIADKMGSGFDAAGFVSPGLWCRNGDQCAEGMCPDGFTRQLKEWKDDCRITSGWLWRYDDVLRCKDKDPCSGAAVNTMAYAQAILGAFS